LWNIKAPKSLYISPWHYMARRALYRADDFWSSNVLSFYLFYIKSMDIGHSVDGIIMLMSEVIISTFHSKEHRHIRWKSLRRLVLIWSTNQQVSTRNAISILLYGTNWKMCLFSTQFMHLHWISYKSGALVMYRW
jgi:hypothetical protein